MKTTLILFALAAHAFAAQPVLVRVTAKTLADLQKRDPMIRLVTPAEGEAKVVRPVNQSIIAQSTILNDGKNWTLVPNGAVVFLPESMQDRVNAKPVGNLMAWNDFLAQNTSWISTSEVSFDQAAGNEAIPADSSESWRKKKKMVVAVHQHGPISVRTGSSILTSLTTR
jgi:hypothetical protein